MAETEQQVHISSFVVRCLPDKLQQVMSIAQTLPGVEVHGSDPCGKFVALLELDSERALMDTITALDTIKGVINSSMAYHHVD